MSHQEQRVAVITGGSAGIGAGLVAAYRRQGWAVVASSRTIRPSGQADLLCVAGDIAEPETAGLIVGEALGRFGRIDTLVNDAGVFIAKPFTEYTADDYATIVGVNLTGFFRLTHHRRDPAYRRRSDRRSLITKDPRRAAPFVGLYPIWAARKCVAGTCSR